MTILTTLGGKSRRALGFCGFAGVLCFTLLGSLAVAQQPTAPVKPSPPRTNARPAANSLAAPAVTPPSPAPATAPGEGTNNSGTVNPMQLQAPSGEKSGGRPTDSAGAETKADKEKGHSPQILSWINEKDEDLPLGSKVAYGGLLFLLGAIGALVTAFYSVGDALPGIGGDGLIEPQEAQMKAFEQAAKTTSMNLADVQEKLKACDQGQTDQACVDNLKFVAAQYVEEMKLYEKHSARLRDLVNRNRWRIYGYGLPMYTVIGAATSLLFARDWLQALLFGYSWASVVSTIGLKGTVSQKSSAASQQGEQADDKVKRLKEEFQQERKAMEVRSSTLSAMLALAVKQIPK